MYQKAHVGEFGEAFLYVQRSPVRITGATVLRVTLKHGTWVLLL